MPGNSLVVARSLLGGMVRYGCYSWACTAVAVAAQEVPVMPRDNLVENSGMMALVARDRSARTGSS